MPEQKQFTREQLDASLAAVEAVFDIPVILNMPLERQDIVDYYHANKPGYTCLHSRSGAVHVAVNPGGAFSRRGFRYQAERLSGYLSERTYADVLELGCSRAYNLLLLAKKHPHLEFTGIEIAQNYLQEAQRAVGSIDNVKVQQGDFHAVDFADGSFDLVFAVESLCYAQDHREVIAEIARVLRPGGRLILFDFFRSDRFDACDAQLQRACTLVEKSTAIPSGVSVQAWVGIAESIGFEVERRLDLTQFIMPNLRKFHTLSTNYFRVPGIARVLNKLLPYDLVRNNIAGLLMPYTMSLGAQVYMEMALRKGGD